jgi:general stress protein 26
MRRRLMQIDGSTPQSHFLILFPRRGTMGKEAEITAKLWKALRSDRTVMLGLAGVDEGHSHPMTAIPDDDEQDGGPLWFFTSKDVDLVKAMGPGKPAVLHFASKGHDLFATIHGELIRSNDREAINRLWNSFIAAWFKGGKDDPKLQLLRFVPDRAQIWLNENNLFTAVKLMFGRDPKKYYKDKVAEVDLAS